MGCPRHRPGGLAHCLPLRAHPLGTAGGGHRRWARPGHRAGDVRLRPHQRAGSAGDRSEPLRATSSPAARDRGERCREHPRHQRLLPRLAPPPGARRRARRRRPGGALHPQEARRRASPSTPCATASRRRASARRHRRRRLLRQAADSRSSASCATYLRVGPQGLAPSARRCPSGCGRSSGSRTRSRRACSARLRRCRGRPLLHRAPREPRRQRLLPVALRVGRRPDLRRRGRVGHHQHRRRARATSSSSQRQLNFPHSLGLLYSAFTYFCGFRVNSGEYKLMGLAPYGEPRYADRILRRT